MNFARFLEQRRPGAPVCFWFGCNEPHRGDERGSGLKSGKKPEEVQVPWLPPRYPGGTQPLRLAARMDEEWKRTRDPRLYGENPDIAGRYPNVNPKNKMGEGNYPPPAAARND